MRFRLQSIHVRVTCLLALLATLSACVAPVPLVQSESLLRPHAGFVGGVYSSNSNTGWGFTVENTVTGREILMPFFNDNFNLYDRPEQFSMIELPPGTYRLTGWVSYTKFSEYLVRKVFDKSNPMHFTVVPGRVVFMGKFEALTKRQERGTLYRIVPHAISKETVDWHIKNKHPTLSVELLDAAGAVRAAN